MVDLRKELNPNPVLLGDVDGGVRMTVAVFIVVDAVDGNIGGGGGSDDDVVVLPVFPNRARVC